MRQSLLGHALIVLSAYWLTLLWLNQPRILTQDIPRTTITHYELSEYLPPVNTQREKPSPPARLQAHKADPAPAPQEIVSIHTEHNSLKQTIVQANPKLLTQDVPLPNIVAWTPIPSSAPVAAKHPLQNLPADVPQVVPPTQQIARRNRLAFPALPQPEPVAPAETLAKRHVMATIPTAAPVVVPPAGTVATAHHDPILPLSGLVVVPPSEHPVARNSLQLPVQAPDVAPPSTPVAAPRSLQESLQVNAPQVVPPSQATATRNHYALAAAAPTQTVVPPAEPIVSGGEAESQAMGQLLALNAQPSAPVGPVSVPEGNRRGEFAASPSGRPGATAQPETVAGNNSGGNHPGNASAPANIYISAPPAKIVANAVVAAPASIPPIRSAVPDRADAPTERFEAQVFGARNHYSIRLSMPNLNSAMGSWIMRFARLNSEPGRREDISPPEPVRKVDPGYPASYIHDRVEGVVVLYAIIRSDGSVGDVRVLEGFDSRLDENARTALSQWRFRPGTRNGIPIDVEAVVRVPFRAPKAAF
jgi:TonB family protein